MRGWEGMVGALHQSGRGAAHSCWKPLAGVILTGGPEGPLGAQEAELPKDTCVLSYYVCWALQCLCVLALKSLYLLCLMRIL